MENKLDIEWRANNTPSGNEYMLCHNFVSDVFFIMPRCPVFSMFYVPVGIKYLKMFAKENFDMELPDKLEGVVVLGKGTKKLAQKLKSSYLWQSHYWKNCRRVLDGYKVFQDFIKDYNNVDCEW